METNTKDNFDEFEKYDTLTDKEILTKIWLEPRRVMKFINDSQYEKYFYILLFLAGISSAFDRAALKDLGDSTSLFLIIGICVIFGGFFGWISYYIYALLLSWTGKWIGGKGNSDSLYRILPYAMIPSVLWLFFFASRDRYLWK